MSQECHSLFDELRAYKRSRALAVAFTTGLVDAVGSGEHAAGDIAAACGVPEDWASSLLTVLADLDVVEWAGDRWTLTSTGKVAVADQALRAFAGYHLHCYEAWLDLPDRCGGNAVDSGFHRRAAQNPEFVRSYLVSMDAIAQRSLPTLKKECRLSGSVLDVGAGPSTFCRHLAFAGSCHVTALDLPPLVEQAKGLFEYPACFEWVAADFREYMPEREFDALFCSHLLEYASAAELPVWLSQMRGFLRPGGTAVFLTFLREANSEGSAGLDLFELSTGVNGERLGHVCTSDEFQAALQSAGLAEISCKALSKGPSYPEYLVTCTWA